MRGENPVILITREKISDRVRELAADISRDYKDKNPLLLCVLKGAVIFLADLIRNLELTVELDFIAASSYEKDASKGKVDLSPIFSTDVRAKDVLIVEDILDTGLTYRALTDYFAPRRPASLKLCALLDKPSQRRVAAPRPDYLGFTIPDKFVVGYGLDYEQRHRGLQDICILDI